MSRCSQSPLSSYHRAHHIPQAHHHRSRRQDLQLPSTVLRLPLKQPQPKPTPRKCSLRTTRAPAPVKTAERGCGNFHVSPSGHRCHDGNPTWLENMCGPHRKIVLAGPRCDLHHLATTFVAGGHSQANAETRVQRPLQGHGGLATIEQC